MHKLEFENNCILIEANHKIQQTKFDSKNQNLSLHKTYTEMTAMQKHNFLW